jgi:hypothetical protein
VRDNPPLDGEWRGGGMTNRLTLSSRKSNFCNLMVEDKKGRG